MPGIGYYSGLYEGLQRISNINKQNQSVTDDQIRDQVLQNQDQRDSQKFAYTMRQQALVDNALKGSNAAVMADQNTNALTAQSQRLMSLGNKIMPVNPTLGLKFMQEAGGLAQQSSMSNYHNLRTQSALGEHLANVAYGVHSQSDLDAAVEDFAKNGQVVPPQYQVWNPETEAWWEQRAQGSMFKSRDLKSEASAVRADVASDSEARKADYQSKRLDQIDRDLARKQGNIKGPTQDQTSDEISVLSDDSGYKALSKGQKTAAAESVYYKAQQYRSQGLGPDEAMTKARADVLDRVNGRTSSGPAVGTIVKGYKFKGGDPKDQNNWELQK